MRKFKISVFDNENNEMVEERDCDGFFVIYIDKKKVIINNETVSCEGNLVVDDEIVGNIDDYGEYLKVLLKEFSETIDKNDYEDNTHSEEENTNRRNIIKNRLNNMYGE